MTIVLCGFTEDCTVFGQAELIESACLTISSNLLNHLHSAKEQMYEIASFYKTENPKTPKIVFDLKRFKNDIVSFLDITFETGQQYRIDQIELQFYGDSKTLILTQQDIDKNTRWELVVEVTL